MSMLSGKSLPQLMLIGAALRGLGLSAATTLAQTQTEAPPLFRVADILPHALMAGPNHRVDDRFRNDGYMNHYTILSRFGTFQAESSAEVGIRIDELNALAAMEQVERSA